MGEVSRVLGAAADAVYTVESLGKRFPLYRLTGRVKGAFEDWLEERARAKLRAKRERLDEDDEEAVAEYQREERRIGDNVDALAYSWGTAIQRRAMFSPEGMTHLIYLLTVKGRPEKDAERLEELLAEISAAIDANEDEFVKAIQHLNRADPNLTPPQESGAQSATARP